ncbi:MAG: YhbY family RNA-binding protein [Gemmatimonadetes bacterium]|nr:YhbY family RNA-binding protein [Gemmatimonadota bacterium]
MTMTGKERAALRGEANRLTATVHVGHAGANDSAVRSLDDVLRTHELVKAQLSKQAGVKPNELARQLAVSTRSEVVQVIGRTATFYRPNPELKRKDGTPPWRR